MKKQPSIKLIIATLIMPARVMAFFLFALFAVSLKGQQPQMLMRLVADGNQMQNETVVYFDSAATFNYDPQYDAPSLGVSNGSLNIVTCLNNIDYQIDALPPIGQNMVVPVKITTGTSGVYSVYASDLQNLPEGALVVLHDNYLNTDFNLRNGSNPYFISDTENVARFNLIVSVNVIQNVTSDVTQPTCNASGNGVIRASATGAGPFNYYWKDSLNNIIRVSLNKGSSDTLTSANGGRYRVDVTTPGTNNNATVYFHLSGSLSAQAHFSLPSNSVNLYNGVASVHFTNNSLASQFYTWDFGDGMGSSVASPNHSYNQVGTYTVSLTASNTACPEVSVYRQVLTVNGTTGIVSALQQPLAVRLDGAGYYVTPGEVSQAAKLVVSDLTGRRLSEICNIYSVDKIYLDPALPANQVLLIELRSTDQHLTARFIK